ncbi:putative 2,3-diketo-5-methylthio-1-phosphopentane phosphatase [Corynespora cassiicola Philippines]|uniref:Putative 2,3-diketo-5-methylthio-1-phosphopentane phosphatase n=1 Tax=Corynespora cassiicola Philippines TaxID=1448308 RepID=A0A2T2NM12_CORCC|nr:putative 2,3-diketo-5-methylthio-1-phosphopentane phosphatase [Corynespora cassiicola Philippines]
MAPIAITPPAVEAKSFNLKPVSAPRRDIICFSDFDGTIFMQDTGHILFNNFGCGSEKRKVLDEQIHSGERSFRDVSEEMWGSLDVSFDDGLEKMKDELEIDCDFKAFHEWCTSNNIPFNVISAGLKPVLRRVLNHFLGEQQSKHIDIIANDATISADNKWTPVWLHDCALGHDKAKSINDYKDSARQQSADGSVPLLVFIGDGVSDLPAAREADVLFARRGLRLEEYCIENNLPYIPFDTFADVQREVSKLAAKENDATEAPEQTSVPHHAVADVLAALTPKEEKTLAWPQSFAPLKSPLHERAELIQAAPAA